MVGEEGPAAAPVPRRGRLFWRAQLIGWGLFAVVDLVNRQLIYQNELEALVLTLIAFVVMVSLSGVLPWLYGWLCPAPHLDLRTVVAVVCTSALAAAAVVFVMASLRDMLEWDIPQWRPLEELVLPLAHYALAYVAWSISYFWVGAERAKQRAREREIAAQLEALKAEIRALQLQLDPHFLFNALNGVAEEVPEHPEAALAMIRDLTQYLRTLLAGIRKPVVSVADEAEGLAAYLRIQEARFGARVKARLSLDPAAARWPIANLLLQPLVENAFEHGDRSTCLQVEIRILAEGAMLRIEIANTGRLDGPNGRTHHGIGLENVRRRLDVHYPGRHTFELRQAAHADGAPHPGGQAPGGQEGRVVALLRLEGEPCSAF